MTMKYHFYQKEILVGIELNDTVELEEFLQIRFGKNQNHKSKKDKKKKRYCSNCT